MNTRFLIQLLINLSSLGLGWGMIEIWLKGHNLFWCLSTHVIYRVFLHVTHCSLNSTTRTTYCAVSAPAQIQIPNRSVLGKSKSDWSYLCYTSTNIQCLVVKKRCKYNPFCRDCLAEFKYSKQYIKLTWLTFLRNLSFCFWIATSSSLG